MPDVDVDACNHFSIAERSDRSSPRLLSHVRETESCHCRNEGKMSLHRRSGLATPAVEERARSGLGGAGSCVSSRRHFCQHSQQEAQLQHRQSRLQVQDYHLKTLFFLVLCFLGRPQLPLFLVMFLSSITTMFFCFVSSLAHVLKDLINCLSPCITVRVSVVGPRGPEVILQVIASQISLPSYKFNLYLKKHDLAFCNCSK